MTFTVLGVDIGTTAIKAAMFDSTAAELDSNTAEYVLQTPQPGHVELDVRTYVTTFKRAVMGMDLRPTNQPLVALGLSSQGETLLCLDENFEPIGPAIVWMDTRATAEADELEAHFGRTTIHARTGQVSMDAIWPAAKILWLKHHRRDIFDRTHKFVLLKDYLVQLLTGNLVSEDSLLCSTILWDINTREYWQDMLDYLEVNTEQLPQIAAQGQIVGAVTDTAAEVFGLPVGLAVSVGALDQACGALGVGNVVPGTFSESTGSALTSVTIVDELTLDPAGRVPCFPAATAGRYMLHNFSTGAMVMRWFRDEFCGCERDVEQSSDINAYTLIDHAAARVPPGSDGLVVLPHLQGSGPPDLDANARGVIFGLTLAHKKGHLARGIMEGVTMVLRSMIESTLPLGGRIDEVISLGGGAKSPVWCQIKADATQRPVRTLTGADSSACRGAALLAGAATNRWESVEQTAQDTVMTDRTYLPQQVHANVYDELFVRFLALQRTARGLL